MARTPPPVSLLAVAIFATAIPSPAQESSSPTSQDLEFFERKVRPVLAENCYRCHGPEVQKAGLRLDHITTILTGGARGPAVAPGRPDESLLVTAISYEDVHLQMPPTGRLAEEPRQNLIEWVRRGAPWPDEPPPAAGAATETEFDLQARSAHWCWQPIAHPPAPSVQDGSWPRNPIDRFLLEKLEAAKLSPAADADRATWLRRVTMDLTGLPPTSEEVRAFVEDSRNDDEACAAVVDRLLASPRFGETWARHWLDLVRYAESLGHEYDFSVPLAWRYRDYVIDAWNRDVPYDQFVREHVAGDLLPKEQRRLDPDTGRNASVAGTTFWWLGEQTHSPVDAARHTADRIDNQLDVFSKAFQGVTVACARCHDHKFDAISQADYYAMAGYLKSSRYTARSVVPLAEQTRSRPALRSVGHELAQSALVDLQQSTATARPYLEAVLGLPADGLDKKHLETWQKAFKSGNLKRWTHPFHAFHLAKAANGKDLRPLWRQSEARPVRDDEEEWSLDEIRGWSRVDGAFEDSPANALWWDDENGQPRFLADAGVHSAQASSRMHGVVHSPDFHIRKRYVHVRAAGRESRINLVVEGFHLLRNPIYGGAKPFVNSTEPRWFTIDCNLWQDHQAYLSFADGMTHDLADPHRGGGYRRGGWMWVERVVFSDDRSPPGEDKAPAQALLGDSDPRTAEALVDAAVAGLLRAMTAMREGRATQDQAHLVNFLLERRLLQTDWSAPTADLMARFAALRLRLPEEDVVPGMMDGPGVDEHLFHRGDHRHRGDLLPRRFLEVLGGTAINHRSGSGRLELAQRLTAADNPLTARVIVNRLWHHLFGVGIVPTVDNFGVLGEKPSHPALLDWLATRFVADGWSLKTAIRRMVLSRAYRMASTTNPAAVESDPQNQLLHRMRVRRASAESLRDAILSVSGRLDQRFGGEGVPVHLTDFMTGRGRPRGGPLDGAGRRSIYVQVRRNFLSPWMLAFDAPPPFSTVGRRSRTNVPEQALALLNDPLVIEQARLWARSEIARSPDASPGDRLTAMFVRALAREPGRDELHALLEHFQALPGNAEQRWAEIAHVIFNLKEFAWIR